MQFDMDPDNPPSLDQLPLTPQEQLAKEHWKRFLPNRVRGLEKSGPDELDKALRRASWRTEYSVLLAQARKPNLPRQVAEELFRNEWLFPPPETPPTPASSRPTTT